MTIDEAIEREKRSAEIAELSGLDDPSDHYQMAEWLRAARGADKSAKWYTAKIRELEDKNKKLRELVRHMGACIQHLDRTDEDGGCVRCPYQTVEHDCSFEQRMVELGIEVE